MTDREGKHRFSYTGHPHGTVFLPIGICTDLDAFSTILVCDKKSDSVHMLEKKTGQFYRTWAHVLIESGRTLRPMSLSYDVNTHLSMKM